MQKVIILSSSYNGTAAHHLPYLLQSGCCEVAMVVISQGQPQSKVKKIKRILKKIAKIGVLGAWNGIRMRKWYGELAKPYTQITDIRTTCEQHNIPIHSVPSINSAETVQLFQHAGADVGISLGNGYIAKKVFSTPKNGMINIHHEILPDYQNAQSIIWQLYNNSARTGYTIHKIDQHIDTGDILYQDFVDIKLKDSLADSVAETSSLLLKASAKGLIEVLQNFEQYFNNARPQGHGTKYTTPSFRQYLQIHRNFKKLRDSRHQ